ncbi:MAG: hypothetical protein K6G50_09720 [bacterium]|nr:hypothetical protein [bacterium]
MSIAEEIQSLGSIGEEAFAYHTQGRAGKIEVIPTKPVFTQRDLSLAYTPGVAAPVLAVADDPLAAYDYTAKGNLVAVITNGTAILGLGNRGPLAAKPVMEGKGVLFKRFADIDVFDLELDAPEPDDFIAAVKALAPTFGGINLEDIKAPECFYIEQKLQELLDIPVFHDDQHGTAVIAGAAVLNGLELAGKRIEDVKIVCSGAGAAACASMKMLISLGARPEHIIMADSKGVINASRSHLAEHHKAFARHGFEARTLAEAFKDADVFYGLSVAGIVSADMIRSMAPNPLVLPLANPIPEISYEEVLAARPDAIAGTGRSDYPNQINNVLGFPFIFRGALDTRARCINEEMKIAAVKALAGLAKEPVPAEIAKAYGLESLEFGRNYLLPKPIDKRVLLWEAPAVAQAAMETGAARCALDKEKYAEALHKRAEHLQSLRHQD